jgi:hypothetical protein
LICDQTIVLTGFYSLKGFETPLRRIRFRDPKTGKRLIFLTNNFTLPALTITELYRCRWQVGVSREGHVFKSVKVRPRSKDSDLVAWEVLGAVPIPVILGGLKTVIVGAVRRRFSRFSFRRPQASGMWSLAL